MTQTPPRNPEDRSGSSSRHPGSARKSVIFMTGLLLVMVGGGALAGVLMRSGSSGPVTPSELSQHQVPVTGGQANRPIKTSNANLMGLQQLKAARAPNFTLTDQNGRTISLNKLDRTHMVVLSFMDDRCTDICPIVAQELINAYHDLGSRASDVVFVAVNVNASHNATRWLRAFIAKHGLASVPTFHYVTGSPAALRAVWADYKITVKVDPSTGKVYHSEGMYFIAPGGAQRYEATPFANLRKNGTGWLPKATITQWGQGIAQYAKAASAATGRN